MPQVFFPPVPLAVVMLTHVFPRSSAAEFETGAEYTGRSHIADNNEPSIRFLPPNTCREKQHRTSNREKNGPPLIKPPLSAHAAIAHSRRVYPLQSLSPPGSLDLIVKIHRGATCSSLFTDCSVASSGSRWESGEDRRGTPTAWRAPLREVRGEGLSGRRETEREREAAVD